MAHIGIYVGVGQIIHASGRGSSTVGQYADQCVKYTSVAKVTYYYNHIYNCKRVS
ncbi:MAG: hypothetical protein LUF02_08955 [Erysipelotrichaceae bacterium]|nr:hypothetical protein [Erysipelotrichaceae bacterium]